MLSTACIALVTAYFVVVQCQILPPCPKNAVRLFRSTDFMIYWHTNTERTVFVRIFNNAKAYHTTVNYAEKLEKYKSSAAIQETYTEDVLYNCEPRSNVGLYGVVTQTYGEFPITGQGRSPTKTLEHILTAITTYHAAGIANLHLNSGHLREYEHHVVVLTGPVRIGYYRTRLQYYAPEVLKDASHTTHLNSDTWFAGIIYFNMLTSSILIPDNYRIYAGDLEHFALVYDDDELGDDYKRRLMLVTYYALRMTLFDEALSTEDWAIVDQLVVANDIDLAILKLLHHEVRKNLAAANLSAGVRGLLTGLLTVNPNNRLTAAQALGVISQL